MAWKRQVVFEQTKSENLAETKFSKLEDLLGPGALIYVFLCSRGRTLNTAV